MVGRQDLAMPVVGVEQKGLRAMENFGYVPDPAREGCSAGIDLSVVPLWHGESGCIDVLGGVSAPRRGVASGSGAAGGPARPTSVADQGAFAVPRG